MARLPADPRQRLLDVGLKLFANRGYAGTSVQDITDEAQVTKPTLYYYFGNKEGLFQALVDHAMDERLRLMQEAAPPEKPTVDQLADIVAALTDFAAASRICCASPSRSSSPPRANIPPASRSTRRSTTPSSSSTESFEAASPAATSTPHSPSTS
jgi:AcrR family transcriptional regulator